MTRDPLVRSSGKELKGKKNERNSEIKNKSRLSDSQELLPDVALIMNK